MTGLYIAYPIDQAGQFAGFQFRNEVSAWARGADLFSWIYDPGTAFQVDIDQPITPAIRAVNAEALYHASVLVAHLPAGVPSVGVPMEIERAAVDGKQVVVVSDVPSWMLAYDQSNVLVVSEWGAQAQEWLSEAGEGISEGLGAPGRVSLPVVLDEGAEMPRRGFADDAGLDLIVSQTTAIAPGQFADIPTGVRVELPDHTWGLITGRSSAWRSRGLSVIQGVIDPGYRGYMYAAALNTTNGVVVVEQGERIAQLILLPNVTRTFEPVAVTALAPSERGERGFGSTGT